MDEDKTDINAVIRRLEQELSLHVECGDDDVTTDCDIQRLINAYRTINIAWARMFEVNDHNVEVIEDYRKEIEKLNNEITSLRECID